MEAGITAAGPAFRRVLVVEDEILVGMMLEDMLQEIGHDVVARAARIGEAAELAAGDGFDFAILDVHLNGEEVYPVADVLSRRGIPFVFATGYGEQGLAERYRSHAALSKPYSRNDLERVLAAVLG
jgi:CheY-like chemotaxis protein